MTAARMISGSGTERSWPGFDAGVPAAGTAFFAASTLFGLVPGAAVATAGRAGAVDQGRVDVVDDRRVVTQVLRRLLDCLAEALGRVVAVDDAVLRPVLDHAPPARRLGRGGRGLCGGGDPEDCDEESEGETAAQHLGSVADGS
jgi:hypothetical protein